MDIEERNARRRARYRRQNPGSVTQVQRLAEQRARRLATKDVWRERQRNLQKAWRLANPERFRKLKQAWKQANPEKVRADHKSRKLRKRRRVVDDLLKLQRGRCAYCAAKLSTDWLHVDHIEPLARGGADQRRNLQALCPPCNSTKRAKDPIDFARQTGRLI